MHITNIMAVSLDGKIATGPLGNDSKRMEIGFGCEADHQLVRQEISKADAIITGANSVRSLGGVWDQARSDGKYPTWIVLSQTGLEAKLEFYRQKHIPRWVVSPTSLATSTDQTDPLLKYLEYADQDPAEFVVDTLKAVGAERVLLFGGGYINQMFYASNLVDDLKITVSPVIVGRSDAPDFVNAPLPQPTQLHLVSSQEIDNHLFLYYRIKK